MPEAVSIFILPPSIEELTSRLTTRGEDSAESIAKRLSEAKLEMSQAPNFEYLVINDDFDQAVRHFLSITSSVRLTKTVQLRRSSIQALVGG